MTFGTLAHATAVTILAPSFAIPFASYSFPTINPWMFCKNSRGILRCSQSWMKCAPLSAASEKSGPLLASTPTRCPWILAKPQTSVAPYSGLNSSSLLPSSTRASAARASQGVRLSRGTTPRSSRGSNKGGSIMFAASPSSIELPSLLLSPAIVLRTRAAACASDSASESATPLLLACSSPPPSSSAETSSPVAAFTSGGPPRKMVPLFRTMTTSSERAGT